MFLGDNVEAEVKDGKLTLTIDLEHTLGRSASGKSIVVASTRGNQTVPGTDDLKLGLNAYRKS